MGERRVAVHLAHPWFEERCAATEQHRGKVQAQLVRTGGVFLTNDLAAVRTRGQLVNPSVQPQPERPLGEALEVERPENRGGTAVLHGLAEMPRRPNGFV